MRPQTEAGRIKILAVMGRDRVATLPGIPTAIEAGYPALEMEGLVGLFGIKSLAPALRDRIAGDIASVAADPAVEAKLTSTAQTLNPGGAKEFSASIEHQRRQIATIASAVGVVKKQQETPSR
jgi:tripartite-type tricarboxylate transporter receptor subunit TctC